MEPVGSGDVDIDSCVVLIMALLALAIQSELSLQTLVLSLLPDQEKLLRRQQIDRLQFCCAPVRTGESNFKPKLTRGSSRREPAGTVAVSRFWYNQPFVVTCLEWRCYEQ